MTPPNAVQAGDWQLIETAPTNETVICVWLGAPECHEMDVAVLCDSLYEPPFWCAKDDMRQRYGVPDFWQPMPSFPTPPPTTGKV